MDRKPKRRKPMKRKPRGMSYAEYVVALEAKRDKALSNALAAMKKVAVLTASLKRARLAASSKPDGGSETLDEEGSMRANESVVEEVAMGASEPVLQNVEIYAVQASEDARHSPESLIYAVQSSEDAGCSSVDFDPESLLRKLEELLPTAGAEGLSFKRILQVLRLSEAQAKGVVKLGVYSGRIEHVSGSGPASRFRRKLAFH